MSRTQRQQSSTLIKIDDSEVVRHPVFATQDGYADAREGYPVKTPPHYNRVDRENYLTGYKRGQRVRRAMTRSSG